MSAKVAIIGAGFSGLTLAWSLLKDGFEIEIFEAQERPGGLIQTIEKPFLTESAAHALLASQEVESLFQDLNLAYVKAGHRSKRKWIFRERPVNWPLGRWQTLQMIGRLIRAQLGKKFQSVQEPRLQNWVEKNLSREVNDYLVSPALQGIYGVRSSELSAKLILSGIKNPLLRPKKTKLKGSLAPQKGMGELIKALEMALLSRGVRIHYGQKINSSELKNDFDAVVVASSLKDLPDIIKSEAPLAAREFQDLPLVSLACLTVAFQESSRSIRGFGCLFPENQNFQSLGVLFNTDIFSGRGDHETETWIFQINSENTTEDDLIHQMKSDRKKLVPDSDRDRIIYQKAFIWHGALPLYGEALNDLITEKEYFTTLKDSLSELQIFEEGVRLSEGEKPLYLTGNYLGGIGLTKILSYNQRLSQRMKQELRGDH